MNEIEQYIANNEWISAANAMIEYLDSHLEQFDEKTAILAATISMHLDGQQDITFEYIAKGLMVAPESYELYLLLGEWYIEVNINQAYLCYENALYFCEKQLGTEHEDTLLLHQMLENLCENYTIDVQPVSFVILSWNTLELLKSCLTSIRNTCYTHTYEIIIIDNGSSDGSVEWLRTQSDLTLIENTTNHGFAGGCNQGIQKATPGYDIFLLNSDTEMMFNSLFTLRMGLYSSEKIAAAGAVSNYVHPSQIIDEPCTCPHAGQQYAYRHNLPSLFALEYKDWLVGFAELIKRPVIDLLHGLDEDYPIGNYEDNDLGLRILKSGYLNICCHNSFIFHWGHATFEQNKIDTEKQTITNAEIFKQKWKVDPSYYGHIRTELISLITSSTTDPIEVLEIGCGSGNTLARIAWQFPYSTVHGIEIMNQPAAWGAQKFDIQCGNIETDPLPYPKACMDYIIFGDVLEHLHDPEAVLQKIKPYLKPTGCLIISLPNIMNARIIYNLLRGYFTYEDAGILDRTHLKFFTYFEILQMMERNGYVIDSIHYTISPEESTEAYKEFFNQLCTLKPVADRQMFDAYQYFFRASIKRS